MNSLSVSWKRSIEEVLLRACPKTQRILRDHSLEIFNKLQ
ncbi:hypothetical protein LEP1GSC041_3529 [Leptospira noguchii str. 2006001870]|uniref:Uncharacterized protein n=1 Tax=Leptospira noguchii serovar Autumnalis str. ZUN142 TaxID=1085540 RepID=M6U2Z8_9LEPT|nr:hypothetical protein LEP1GSC041_3529 [Leptospira noguchii str. 2006001870]EMO29513.1 hypothetical protein LEP1GSC170_4451 [Leptospira interrogans serovar Bataviae str. HAI135]EMO38865.1 hypothetical protein LEP1GSC186_0125 [Leptospira noguchii serovar Autumnalis str. ZUN142]